jgi:glutamyl-tRNA synthetase
MMVDEMVLVHNGSQERNAEDMQKWITADTAHHLDAAIQAFETCETFTHDSCAAVAKELAMNLGIKLVNLLQPIRLALIGKASGPGVFDLMAVLGKRETLARLKALRANL